MPSENHTFWSLLTQNLSQPTLDFTWGQLQQQLINLLMERSPREVSPKVTPIQELFTPNTYLNENFLLEKISRLGAHPHTAHDGGAPHGGTSHIRLFFKYTQKKKET